MGKDGTSTEQAFYSRTMVQNPVGHIQSPALQYTAHNVVLRKLKNETPKTRLTLYIPEAMLQCVSDIAASLQQSRLKTIDQLLDYAIRQASRRKEILLEDYPKAQCQYCSILCSDSCHQTLQHLAVKTGLKKTEVVNRLIWYSLNHLPDEMICANRTNHSRKIHSELR